MRQFAHRIRQVGSSGAAQAPGAVQAALSFRAAPGLLPIHMGDKGEHRHHIAHDTP